VTTIDDIITRIIKTEGGYSDRTADRGGPTNMGITLKTLQDWRHDYTLTAEAVKDLKETEARAIYLAKYVKGPGLDRISGNLQVLLVDMFVLHGPKNAALITQHALGLPGDGIFGEKTLSAVMSVDHGFERVLAERFRFLGRLIHNDPTQAANAAGWMDRAADFLWAN
jgi:lysozyme family protein